MILSIDLGTSSVKGAVFLETRLLRDLGRVNYKKQSADSWIDSICQLIMRLSWSERADIESIALSGQGPTIVPILVNDQVLKPIFYYQNNKLLPPDKKEVFSYFLPKVAYFLSKKSHLHAYVRYFMSAPDYVIYWLTGEAFTSLPNEAYYSLIWSEQEIARYNFLPRWFPPYAAHRVVGIVKKKLQYEFFFQRDVVVYTAMFDFLAALVGSGSISQGDVLNRAGMSEGINFIVEEPPLMKTLPKVTSFWRISPHILPNLYNLGVVFDKVGNLLEGHAYDVDDPVVQLHIAKITHIWNQMKDFSIKKIRLCGGQVHYPQVSAFKKRLSHYPIEILHYPPIELVGNAVYAAWLSGYYSSLHDGIKKFTLDWV